MQRNSFILRNIILPNIFPPSSPHPPPTTKTATAKATFSTVSNIARSQAHSESSSGQRDKTIWSTPNAGAGTSLRRVLGHDPPRRHGMVEGGSEGEDRRKATAAAQQRTRLYLGLEEGQGRANGSQAETSTMALQRILQAYNIMVPSLITSNPTAGKSKGEEELPPCRLHSSKYTLVCVEAATLLTFPRDANSTLLNDTAKARVMPALPSTTTPPPTTSTRAPTLNDEPSFQPNDRITIVDDTVDHAVKLRSQTATTATHTPSPFPPLISRLLNSRLYRLSVFHLLSAPEYATQPDLLHQVADHLELSGAGKLAKRLRRGLELSFGPGNSGTGQEEKIDRSEEKSKVRLWSDPKISPDPSNRLPPYHWASPNLPPLRPSESPNLTRQQALTKYYNSHLLYLLTRSSTPTPTRNHLPALSSPTTSAKLNDWPAPTPSLRQLRKLLDTISRLEKHRGFVPDRMTANIIVRCWLRCATSTNDQTVAWNGDGDRDEVMTRRYRDKSGQMRVVKKTFSEKNGFGKLEIRALFDVVSKAMSESKVGDGAGYGEKEWTAIIRPFGKIVIKALKEKGDPEGVEKVRGWMKREKQALIGGN
ncbi:hypothetical protein IAR55_003219 [Kwoniella newhampshirensis]|uniref:Uncharacterized protein n=1 Tax=Kwoniella newhampshirensis TaxID=1651941 RepID=A0AAW0YN58_9TREE